MRKHPGLAAAVLGLLTSSRERAALRIDHRLDLRSSLLVVALKGISKDHVSLPAVSYNHPLDGRWFMLPVAPLRSRRSRRKPGACRRAGIRSDRGDAERRPPPRSLAANT